MIIIEDISKKYNLITASLMGMVCLMYLYESVAVHLQSGYRFHHYYFNSFLWILVIIYLIKIGPRVNSRTKGRDKSNFIFWSIICGIIYIMGYMLAGAFNEFGKNPYVANQLDMILRATAEISKIIGRESIRFFILNRTYKRHRKIMSVSILLLMIVTEIPVIQILKIDSFELFVIFAVQLLAPTVAKNVFLNYTSRLSNVLSCVIYSTFTSLFLLILPVLPELPWLIKGGICTLLPLFSYMILTSIVESTKSSSKHYREKPKSLISWFMVCFLSISMIWFSTGVFDVFPAVIVTGSMEPVIYPGDMVLLSKIKDRQQFAGLKIGDVIQFQRKDGLLIVHRVIEVVDIDGVPGYRTKGDNNSVEDTDLVFSQDIKGKLYTIIPKIGIPTLIFKSDNHVDLSDVVF